MRSKLLFVLFCSVLISCNTHEPNIYTLPDNTVIPKVDIIYQTISNNHEKIGFIESDGTDNQIVDLDKPIQTPIWVTADIIAFISKQGNMGIINQYSGNLIIIPNNQEYLGCWLDYAEGREIHPHMGNILLSTTKSIHMISVTDCSFINTLLTESDLRAISDKPSITSFSITQDGTFIVLGLHDTTWRLVRYKIKDKTIHDYNKIGYNPSISPDNKLVSYIGVDGIRVMDINGSASKLVIPYETIDYFGGFSSSDIPPTPEWSPNGEELLYHKCNRQNVNCGDIGDYGIYTYNIETGVETFIVGNGINPSWYPIE